MTGAGFASISDMRRTLFSIAIIGLGFGIGGFETGDGLPKPPEKEWAARNAALTRARVLRDEPFDASTIDFAADPNSAVVNPKLTVCKYTPDEVSGTTPKFDCVLENGDKVKVKYGYTKEIPSEIVASRLLHAMGFGADRVSRVETVRCHGCPFQPFHTRTLWEIIGLTEYMDRRIDHDKYRDFEHVSVERNFDGSVIEVGHERGWGFYELDKIDAAKGGATRAEIDALRLMAVFLHHWDNKTSNQRLTCPNSETGDCKHPLAMIQDVGSNFGPKKMHLENWTSRPVWTSTGSCTVSMKSMPYKGGTFVDARISEEGRRLLGDRLRQLRHSQIESLFASAGVEDARAWTAAFQDKVRQIADRPSCPTTTKPLSSRSSPRLPSARLD
jgi:hypothetical protein